MKHRDTALPLEELGASPAAALERATSGETLIITRDGRPEAALIGLAQLEAIQRERELLRRLALGELESAAGEGDDLGAVLEDCRLLLEES